MQQASFFRICRDCGHLDEVAAAPAAPQRAAAGRCPACGSPRRIGHPELLSLAIAHIDCDAFYATVEKREDPSLTDKPVIVGGGRRGVVSAACYLARSYGVRSAMPMFKALALCPKATVIRPRMSLYATVGRQVRELMQGVTPLVEPLSVDEAFLDLTGTERLHRASPAETLATLARRIETELGITVSVGLSFNKFLAKMASEIDKPRGFAVVGRADVRSFLDPQPIRALWGIGPSMEEKLQKAGWRTIGDLHRAGVQRLAQVAGSGGAHLAALAAGEDARTVHIDREAKSISAENTFHYDLIGQAPLAAELWPLAERVSARLKQNQVATRTVVLTLRTAKFKRLSRRVTIDPPTQLAQVLYDTALALLQPMADLEPYRLIGVGTAELVPAADADSGGFFDSDRRKTAAVERALDQVRAKLGQGSIKKGRGWQP
jgi:DNA polymerase-4